MSNGLKVEKLSFKDVLKDINFKLQEGTINALMGKSGSGKTLLLKSLFGLIEYQGIISVNDVIITKANNEELRKKFSIYLGLNNFENKSVFSSIIDPLINLNYDEQKAKKKVYDISKKLGIEKLLHKEFNMLSHSEKKVVLFAQSLIHEPKIILLDSIFESLDKFYIEKIILCLNQLKKKKCIIIFTTNNSEDLWFSDNLLIIKNGKIIVNDSVDNLMNNESLFIKNNLKLPFLAELSYKLKAYDLIDRLIFNYDEMVDEIWQ